MKYGMALAVAALVLVVMLSGCPKPEDIIKPQPGDKNAADVNDKVAGPVCGDAKCESPEAAADCPQDCGAACGDGACTHSETPESCPADCASAGKIEQEVRKCLAEGTALKRDRCLIELGKKEKNGEVCGRVSGITSDSCYVEIASAVKDYGICSRIGEPVKRNSCIKDVALNATDEAMCSKIDAQYREMRDGCYDSIAFELRNGEICLKISDIGKRDSCIYDVAKKTKKADWCRYVSGSFVGETYIRDDCYVEAGGGSAAVCGNLIDAKRAQECYAKTAECGKIILDENRSQCYYTLAKNSKDYRVCLSIPDNYSDLRDACIDEVASKNPSRDGCGMMSEGIVKSGCYCTLGIEQSDTEICGLILNYRAVRDDCYLAIAIGTSDENVCGKIIANDLNKRDYCYSEIALLNLDLELCAKVTASTHYIACYSRIALEAGEVEICTGIPKEFGSEKYISKDVCYFNYAIGRKDTSYCTYIKTEKCREECLAELGG